MKPELIIAVDLPTSAEIPQLVESLPDSISYFKIGFELFTSEGPAALDYLLSNNKKVFLDLKLHDIPRTVANAVTAAASLNVSLLTVHASGGREMLTAAAEAAEAAGINAPKLIAVTTLTSLDENDFKDLGINRDIKTQALALGKLAISSGIDGLVTSALEVESLRQELGNDPLLVTPGIRLQEAQAGNETADQKRIATPAMAVKGGSSFLVVGRPIVQAENPALAAQTILDQINQAIDAE